jgi:glutathione S-transferase
MDGMAAIVARGRAKSRGVKLFGHDTSPYVRRARVLLTEKAIPFERDPAGWVSPSDEFSRLNPLMRVPALLHRGQALLDSRLIAAYLYERFPAPPPDPPTGHPPLQATLWSADHRYDDENVLLAIEGALDSAINVFLMEQDGIPPAASAYLRRQTQRTARCLAFVDGLMAGKSTLHEGVLSFNDITLCCALDWMTFRKRYDVAQHGNLVRFLAAHGDRPSLRSTHPSLAAPAPAPRAAD